MLFTSMRTKHLNNLPTSITIGNTQIPFKESAKNLGFTFDCHLTMNAHVHLLFLLLLFLSGTLFQIMPGVPHHCHHLSLV